MDVLGIDVGGTRIKALRTTADGTIAAEASVATPGTAEALTAAVVAVARQLRGSDTGAVGVVAPGLVDHGVVRWAANLPWREEPLQQRLSDALELPVVVAHDVAAAALAESEAAGRDDLLFVALGTGIAGAHIVGGAILAGATGHAGEIGHTPVHPDGDRCACGQLGCLETYASAAAIARRYTARSGREADAAELVTRLGSDEHADAVWQQAIDALALALATDTLVFDPECIVLGGGLADAGAALFEPLRTALKSRLVWREAPPLLGAALGARAGQLGAARLAWPVLGEPVGDSA